ncbi:DNA ligase, partial [Vibrio metschnikovii]|nr:DNA ligase [Vibrio metschnikovii]
IGSGLTDQLRQTPPKIGCLITYQYNGYTDSGIPRFARFMRNREIVC